MSLTGEECTSTPSHDKQERRHVSDGRSQFMSYSRWRAGVHGRLCQGHGEQEPQGMVVAWLKAPKFMSLYRSEPKGMVQGEPCNPGPPDPRQWGWPGQGSASRAQTGPSNAHWAATVQPSSTEPLRDKRRHWKQSPVGCPATSGPLHLLSSQAEAPRSRCAHPLAAVLGLPPQGTQLDCTRNVCPYPVSLHHFTAHPALPG